MSEIVVFYIFDSQTKEQAGPFSELEFKSLVNQMSPEERLKKHVWKTGMSNWITAAEYFREAPKIPIENIAIDMDADIGGEASKITRIDLVRRDLRRHTRFDYRMKCRVKTSHSEITAYTKDVSLGGVQLEEVLPREALGQSCQITLSSPDGSDAIVMNMKLASRGEAKYFYFTDFLPTDIEKLQSWLVQMSKKEIKKPKLKL